MIAARWEHPTTQGPRAAVDVHNALRVFYAFEAELLDEWRIDEWLKLVSTTFRYTVPVPLLSEGYDQLGYDTQALMMDESRDSIAENWAARFTDEHEAVSWADNPPVRIKRFMSALRARATDREGTYLVRLNVRASMSRQDAQTGEMVGERFDIIAADGDSFVIESRFVTFTDLVLNSPRLRIIL